MQPKGRTATTTSLAAPIGGWNARDSLANMQPLDAVQLVNLFPTPTDVTLRQGYTKYSTGISGQVNSLMNYNGATTQTLFAVSSANRIYRCDSPTASSVYTNITNSKFQHVNVSTQGGYFLSAVNGTNPAMLYDGTNWFSLATTETPQTIASLSHTGATALATTALAHGLVTGNKITVTGASPSDYNGTFIITVLNSTQFNYTMATTPATNATVNGSYTVLGISGVDSSTFINVNLFKNRLYYTQKDTLKVWYLGVNAIAGAAHVLDFGGIARMGGYIQAMGTWTLDAGQGADDYAVFVTSMGEVIVYNGTDPTDAATWALKGVWQLGQTFNRRCFFKWAGDLLLLTQDGLVPLSSALQSSRLDPRINLTDKIYYAVSQAATDFYDRFGWQINYFASQNMLILNIPVDTGTEQYVMHTITKSWAKFTNIPANCWEVNGTAGIYFGSNGFVGKFYDGYDDAGNNILATAQQAYSYFDSPGQLKRFMLVRPTLQTYNGVPTVLCGISVDYDTQNQLNQVSFNPNIINIGKWDVSTWDNANWGGGNVTTKIWQGVTGLGFAGSVNLNIASSGIELHWLSTDYVMERGGVL
jgi:hypothetical protein